jgi:hypothetical protein
MPPVGEALWAQKTILPVKKGDDVSNVLFRALAFAFHWS